MLNRTVYCEDALNWLQAKGITAGTSLVASLPDFSEFPSFTLEEWKNWFTSAALLILNTCPDDGVTVFYQSDIKHQGFWVDKSYLCQKAAEQAGQQLLWHKIVCRAPAGTTTFGRPSYSHLLCFSRNLQLDPGQSTPDVLAEMGDKAWERGMGLNACLMVARFIKDQTMARTIINPFCGLGSMLAAANAFELEAIGIERSPKRAEKARHLRISSDLKNWLD